MRFSLTNNERRNSCRPSLNTGRQYFRTVRGSATPSVLEGRSAQQCGAQGAVETQEILPRMWCAFHLVGLYMIAEHPDKLEMPLKDWICTSIVEREQPDAANIPTSVYSPEHRIQQVPGPSEGRRGPSYGVLQFLLEASHAGRKNSGNGCRNRRQTLENRGDDLIEWGKIIPGSNLKGICSLVGCFESFL